MAEEDTETLTKAPGNTADPMGLPPPVVLCSSHRLDLDSH